MCSSSCSRVWALDAGMTKLESSTNLNISFPANSERIFAGMLRAEYSCTGPFLGNSGSGDSTLGGLKHETFFEIFPMLFQAGF